jgi:hypothetical protein
LNVSGRGGSSIGGGVGLIQSSLSALYGVASSVGGGDVYNGHAGVPLSLNQRRGQDTGHLLSPHHQSSQQHQSINPYQFQPSPPLTSGGGSAFSSGPSDLTSPSTGSFGLTGTSSGSFSPGSAAVSRPHHRVTSPRRQLSHCHHTSPAAVAAAAAALHGSRLLSDLHTAAGIAAAAAHASGSTRFDPVDTLYDVVGAASALHNSG